MVGATLNPWTEGCWVSLIVIGQCGWVGGQFGRVEARSTLGPLAAAGQGG